MQSTQVDNPSSFWSGLTRLVEGPIGWLVTLIVIPALLAAVLLLPPINLISYLEALTYTRISPAGGVISDPDGTNINFPAEGIGSTFLASVGGVPRTDFMAGRVGRNLFEAASNLPTHLVPKSPFYEVDVSGTTPTEAVMTIPIPLDSKPYERLSVYSWTGNSWEYIPSTVFETEEGHRSTAQLRPRQLYGHADCALATSSRSQSGVEQPIAPRHQCLQRTRGRSLFAW